ncbi:MAG: hypothetical protein HY271_05520 [Deltaproteobacteria bacterium]|nr:hypothetical protein [Deltaproteobacteria bacterium]
MKIAALLLSALVASGTHSAWAAIVTVTDCAADPHIHFSKSILVDAGLDDLTLACQLVSATQKIRLHGNAIKVQGPAGGISSGSKGTAVEVHAGADITIDKATLEATNGNGSLRLISKTGLTITNTNLLTGVGDRNGRQMRLQCTDPNCPLTMTKSNLVGHFIHVLINGPINVQRNTVFTGGPRDLIDVRALLGDALLCCDTFQGGNESNAFIRASGVVDLRFSSVMVSENISVDSGINITGVGDTNLGDATLNNEAGKFGEIVVRAGAGRAQINIQGATLLDDDLRSPGDVSELNGREQLPHQGFNNTVGTPDTDS